MTATHTIRIANVGYEHRGRLFGHDLFRPGKVHAHVRGPETSRSTAVGTVYTTVCGRRVNAARAEVSPAGEGPAVTCGRCRRILRAA
jgi:hypothetical protein